MPKVTEAHLEARRNQILTAACKCFARQGFHQTTMRDLCQEAELSPGAIYNYFKSKDDIIKAMAEMGRKNTHNFLQSTRPDDPAPRALAAMLGSVVDFLDTSQGTESARLDVRLWGELIHAPHVRKLFLEGCDSVAKQLTEILQEGQRRGEISPQVSPDTAARVFVAIILGLQVQKAMNTEWDLTGCTKVITALLDGSFPAGSGK